MRGGTAKFDTPYDSPLRAILKTENRLVLRPIRAISLQSFKIRIGFIKHILSYSTSKLKDDGLYLIAMSYEASASSRRSRAFKRFPFPKYASE